MKSKFHFLSVFTLLVILLSSCSKGNYVNNLPKNAVALLSINGEKLIGAYSPFNVLLMSFVNDDKTQLKGIDLTKDIYFFETADGSFGMCAPIADDYEFHDFITRLCNIGGLSELKHEKDVNYCFYKNQWAIMYNNHCLLVMGPTMASKQAQEKIISRMQNGGTGKLTIGCDVTSMDFPSRCIADFTSKYSGISVELKRLEAADRSLAVTGGDYDFCFMPRDMVPESSGIETLVTHIEPLVVLASANGDFRRKKSLSLGALADKKLVLLSESAAPILYMEIMDMLRTFHITPTVDGVFDELAEVYAAVLSGMGVSVVPQSLADLVSGNKAISIPISDADTGIAYVMAWSKTISNPVARLFIETVKKYAEGGDSGYGL